MPRVQVILDEKQREMFRQLAEREGLSLSAWLRQLGLERVRAEAGSGRIETVAAMQRFFRDCERRNRGKGREPDWEEHLVVMDRSRSSGQSGT